MRSYRELFRVPEYTPFFFSFAAQNAALTIGGLSLATLVTLVVTPGLTALLARRTARPPAPAPHL